MKTIKLTWIIACFLPLGLNASILKNSDFEKGSTGWKGDKNIEYETYLKANKVCRIEVDAKDQEFYQQIKSKDAKDLVLTFRVRKSADYEGRGISVRFTREDTSYTFYDRTVKGEDWQEIRIRYSDLQGSKEIKFSVIVRSGKEGHIDFDDFLLVRE